MTRTPSQSRSLLLDITDQLSASAVVEEMVRFLSQDQVEAFMDHLCEMDYLEDLKA